METASCSICVSSLRSEIETKDARCKAAETIQWARKQGVNINKFSLAKHRANHMRINSESTGDIIQLEDTRPGLIPEGEASPISKIIRRRRNGNKRDEGTPRISVDSGLTSPEIIQNAPAIKPEISDHLFLDTIRDMVYEKLLAGEMELKVDSAFKAIEIKHKIAEESQNEKLLLEILNEIRSEELAK